MPKLSLADLQKKLHETLLNGEITDNLAEHKEDIEALSEKDQIELATNLILADSESQLKYAIEASKSHATDGAGFHTIMQQVTELQFVIENLSNPSLEIEPQVLSNCERFPILVDTLAGRSIENAGGNKERNNLVKSSRNCFGPGSTLNMSFQSAALTARLLDLLESENPASMFCNEEFKADLFNTFPEMVSKRLGDKAKLNRIAEILVNNHSDQLSDICKKLESLTTSALEQGPFRTLRNYIEIVEKMNDDLAEIRAITEASNASPSQSGMFSKKDLKSIQRALEDEVDEKYFSECPSTSQ